MADNRRTTNHCLDKKRNPPTKTAPRGTAVNRTTRTLLFVLIAI